MALVVVFERFSYSLIPSQLILAFTFYIYIHMVAILGYACTGMNSRSVQGPE
jgi:hypothetical protein